MLSITSKILLRSIIQPAVLSARTCGAHAVETMDAANSAHFTETTPDESQKILTMLNNTNFEQISTYDITKARANKLLAWRTRNGPLQRLEDILLIDGFSIKTARKLYRSIVSEQPLSQSGSKTSRGRNAPFVTPNIEDEQRSRLRSCVALRIGVSSVTWARLELPNDIRGAANEPWQLTHWQHHEIAEKKLHLSDLVNHCLYVNQQIPSGDCYLFESPQMAQQSSNPGSVDQQNISIQKAQVTAVMGYALAARPTELRGANVFYLRRFLAARLFNHLVGTERVSSEQMMLQLMRTCYNVDDLDETVESDMMPSQKQVSHRNDVHFPQELRQMFAKAGRYQREFLGQSLLLNLAFVRLVLQQDDESIAMVTRNPNK